MVNEKCKVKDDEGEEYLRMVYIVVNVRRNNIDALICRRCMRQITTNSKKNHVTTDNIQ